MGSKYEIAIRPFIGQFKEQIEKSKDGVIRVRLKDVKEEMGKDFVTVHDNTIYSRLKDVLLENGIKMSMEHINISRDKLNITKDKILKMTFAKEDEIISAIEAGGLRYEKSAKNAGFETSADYTAHLHYMKGENKGPMETLSDCPLYFGQYIEEKYVVPLFAVKTFYDILGASGKKPVDWECMNGYKIKHVASCIRQSEDRNDYWGWSIRNNNVPDYFMLSGWDNRTSLKPSYIWLIKTDEIITTERTKKAFWDRENFTIYYTLSNILRMEKYEIDKVEDLKGMLKDGVEIGPLKVEQKDILKMK